MISGKDINHLMHLEISPQETKVSLASGRYLAIALYVESAKYHHGFVFLKRVETYLMQAYQSIV
jgi:hypothetical protein